MQIVKLENVVLQNNCLFVYDQFQKRPSITFDNHFHKTTADYHSHNTRGEKLKVTITKTSTYGLQSNTSSLIRDWNNLNSKTSTYLLILLLLV